MTSPLVQGETVAQLLDLFGDDPAGLTEAFDLFVEVSSGDVAAMTAAADDGDAHRVSELAHRVAGSAASFGAAQLAGRSREVSTEARRGEVPAPAAMGDLMALQEASAAALREALGLS